MSFDTKFSKLFEPGRIGAIELKNRIVMSSMGTDFVGESDEVTDTLINWLAKRAKGGAGLIITESCFAATAIDPLRISRVNMRADDIRYIPGLERLVRAIHENGAKAAIQLLPGAGAVAVGRPWIDGTLPQPVSPSGIPPVKRDTHPRSLTTEEVDQIAGWCGISARNMRDAGFDIIEIHAHAGQLVSQFLSPYFNRRTDKYGGSLDNRCRFLMEIVDSVRKVVGPDFPLIVKYPVEDSISGSWDADQARILARKLETAGVGGISVSFGAHSAKIPDLPPYYCPRGVFIPFAEVIKKVVKIPVLVSGRLDDPYLANKMLKDGKTDFICLGRSLIADPSWPEKVFKGQINEVRPCLACNECRRSRIVGKGVRCSVNAVAGKEGEFDSLEVAKTSKRVMVVGGGPAGMEAARVAALKGHEVMLFEKNQQLGGLMQVAGIHNYQITAFVKWLVSQVRKLPIEIRLQAEVTPAIADEIKPDVVIMAVGGTFVKPQVPGINRDNVFSAQDILKLLNGFPINKRFPPNWLLPFAKPFITASMMRRFLRSNLIIKKKVAIIGGQFPGCSLALLLSEMGKDVTVIEESDRYGKDMEENIMLSLENDIEVGRVKMFTSSKVDRITAEGVVAVDEKGKSTLYEVDNVILALELAPSDNRLADELRKTFSEVHVIGDAKSFRRIIEAISEGYSVAYKL